MLINLDYRDARPIYEQIKDGMIELAVTGAVGAGDKLPSVRELAVSLAINPNTIQRAYRELEAEGFIYSVAGKGSFFAGTDIAAEKRKKELMQSFLKTAGELEAIGCTAEELCELLRKEINND